MVNFSIIISNSEITGPGGLFDFGATLPIVALQFTILMVILNIFLYNPLLDILEKRNDSILMNLAEASKLLNEANAVTAKYEQKLANVRKETQLEFEDSQKLYKAVFGSQTIMCQIDIEQILESFITELFFARAEFLTDTDPLVSILCRIIQFTTSPVGNGFNK